MTQEDGLKLLQYIVVTKYTTYFTFLVFLLILLIKVGVSTFDSLSKFRTKIHC